METTVINATEYRNVSLALLTESKTNPRRIFEDAALKELAESIRTQGILSPLLVRPLTENGFEIVAGARRYRAAQMAEAATVPVRIVNLNDAEALEAQLVENLIRADVHPMEEAQGFKALLDLEEPTYSIEQIAAKTGKSPAFVAARLKLVDLVPVAVEAFYRDEIGVGHALLLAKLPANQQEQALPACFREDWSGSSDRKAKRILLPVRSLQFWIEQNVLLLLKDARFDKRDAHLVAIAGSCVDCPKRTGHNKLLFSDLGKQDACKLCGIWANCESFLLTPRRRAARVRRAPPPVCSSGASIRRSTCLVILLSTLSAGNGALWLRPILMLGPGSPSSPIAAWPLTRWMRIHAD